MGNWIIQAGSVVADDVSKRIEALIGNTLKEVGSSEDGWGVLYIDSSDGRYWELTYPDSDAHSGGAPKLSVMAVEQAKAKYGL